MLSVEVVDFVLRRVCIELAFCSFISTNHFFFQFFLSVLKRWILELSRCLVMLDVLTDQTKWVSHRLLNSESMVDLLLYF